ncbi:nitronate monooxygenase [Lactonifactor sp. BIOML-A3]|uniref:NAD(P)H-dependent flavin oxidoreductase n=1 Tax=Lactonifactor TaxID=420345 RepID=UPI0012B017C5|nr:MULTISPECIES: nitronate monooxygenase family protein [Lactonifactor]MCB5712632.1 nitronate monooxygenase family protein [Lactonifactor longoviformis]MCB5716848.1 nitronate monooxygenase family protein [Lactonifactor longoviformis]MSA01299.1 nitronate monooxygenase [Lactonifactor sp. BIOML-A5]MSA07327.1 nitronate monooxygenase [Lactonifactor sp. BIOML-A4]MSA12057.1 nitronate monooxygenase [Lactonifactor sp. BIOML-A3]
MDRKPLKIGELTARIPVIQGGMGVGVSLGGLAGSVAAAGGVGVISTAQIGWREEDFKKNPMDANFRAVKKEIAKARELAQGGIIGVNIMVATQHYQDYVKTAVSAGIDLIISGAGLPIDLPRMVENTKTKIAPIVSSLKSLHVICKMWDRKYHRAPDLVVIEGPKAGGHLGFTKEELSDMEALDYDSVIRSIIRQTKEYEEKFGKEIPVVVAGGIFDREDMDHALSLGADGVQMGTRFVTTYECDASPAYKQAYLEAEKEDICIVQSPVGMPGRAIKNAFMERVQAERQPIPYCYHCITTCRPKEIPYCITDALVQAVEGNVDNGLLFCGANAYRCRRLEHVKDIFQELA